PSDLSGALDARAEPRERAARLLRPHHLVPARPPEARRHRPRRGGGRRLGQVHPWHVRGGHVDLPRRPRSGGPATPDRRSAHGPGHAPALAGLPPDPEQRAVPGREEEDAEDVSLPWG